LAEHTEKLFSLRLKNIYR